MKALGTAAYKAKDFETALTVSAGIPATVALGRLFFGLRHAGHLGARRRRKRLCAFYSRVRGACPIGWHVRQHYNAAAEADPTDMVFHLNIGGSHTCHMLREQGLGLPARG